MSVTETDAGSSQGITLSEELPPLLSASIASLNSAIVEGPEPACRELQRCFRVLTWYTCCVTAAVAGQSGLGLPALPPQDADMVALQESLSKLLLALSKLPEDHPLASHVFRIF